MKIEKNKVVAISYKVEVEGKVVDQASSEKPLDYIQGTGMLLPGLENAIEGKEEGEEFACTILPQDAYGEYDLKKVFDIPKDIFVINGTLREDLLVVGRYIPLLNSAGEVCNAMVVDVQENKVTMDFNAPMAGKTLNFSGRIELVRDATEKELDEGLHGEFLPHEGGCCHGHCHKHDGDGEGCHCHGDHEDGGCCGGEGGCGCGHCGE